MDKNQRGGSNCTPPTSPRRSPPSEAILQEWAQHCPFTRASAELIQRAQQAERMRRAALLQKDDALM